MSLHITDLDSDSTDIDDSIEGDASLETTVVNFRPISAMDEFTTTLTSAIKLSPSQVFTIDDEEDDVPKNPFRLESGSNHDRRGGNSSHDSIDLMPSPSNEKLDPKGRNNLNDDKCDNDQSSLGLQQNLALSLSPLSEYDTEEDEDGFLRRFHTLISLESTSRRSIKSDEDDESVHSALNISTDTDQGNASMIKTCTSDSVHSRGTDSNGENNEKQKPQKNMKRPKNRIKVAINGMRKAHQDAQHQRSTRRFLAMSEDSWSARNCLETICLSPWCDFSYGRGMALMLVAASLSIFISIALEKTGHSAWGIITCTLGIGSICVRRFWVPIHWLLWGQFIQQRRRRNMQVYDGQVKRSLQNFEPLKNFDDGEMEFKSGSNQKTPVNNVLASGEMA